MPLSPSCRARTVLVAAGTACAVVLLLLPAASAASAPRPRTLGVGVQGTAAAPRLLTATQVIHVSPVNDAHRLKAGYRVTSSGRGYCWTNSFLNSELYRCLLGNYIYDPCWALAGRSAVACLLVPWSHHVTRLRLTRPLPRSSVGHGAIWGLRMFSGVRCQFASGTRSWFHGHPINYYCRQRWALLGAPDRFQPTWQIQAIRRVRGQWQARGSRLLSRAWRPTNP
jgi:hypothetical protein